MGQIISIFNQKGGVAKTSTATNLGSGLASKGKKVLLVDFDPQANTTNSVGFDDEQLETTVYNLLGSQRPTKEQILNTIQETKYENLFLLPSDISLANAEQLLSNVISRETILYKVLIQITDDYDYILIDCPPSLGLLSINALASSDQIIIPVYPSFFSVKGIRHLLNTYQIVKENLKPNLDIMGVLLTKFDSRKNLAKDIREGLISHFGNKVFNTTIRVNSQIEYAQDNQVPLIYYNNSCNGYTDYMNLTEEVLAYGQ
jgi:chromosome partitioning protein